MGIEKTRIVPVGEGFFMASVRLVIVKGRKVFKNQADLILDNEQADELAAFIQKVKKD